jgi:hypothetical protein
MYAAYYDCIRKRSTPVNDVRVEADMWYATSACDDGIFRADHFDETMDVIRV